MSAMETLLHTVLKYLGFTRQQFDEGLQHVRQEFDSLKRRAVLAEERATRAERRMEILLAHFGLVDAGEAAPGGIVAQQPPRVGDGSPVVNAHRVG